MIAKKITETDEVVRKRVMGQDREVTVMLDIVKRVVIVFTSNLGIYQMKRGGTRALCVTSNDDY